MTFPFAYFISGAFISLKRLGDSDLEQLGLNHWIGFSCPYASNISIEGRIGTAFHLDESFKLFDYEWHTLENGFLLGVHKTSQLTPENLDRKSKYRYSFCKAKVGLHYFEIPLLMAKSERDFVNTFDGMQAIGERCLNYFLCDGSYDENQMLVDAVTLLNVNYSISLNEILVSNLFNVTRPKEFLSSVVSVLRAAIYTGSNYQIEGVSNG